jgi:hypothetical protein
MPRLRAKRTPLTLKLDQTDQIKLEAVHTQRPFWARSGLRFGSTKAQNELCVVRHPGRRFPHRQLAQLSHNPAISRPVFLYT